MGGIKMDNEKQLKVILADRDTVYLQKLKRCLERKGDIVVVGMTGSGSTALEMIQKTNADIILMDILLSQRDGFWILENLQKSDCICTSIIISAMDSDTIVRRAISVGADYYMAKPIQGELLMERIHQLMGITQTKIETHENTKLYISRDVEEGMSSNNLEIAISAVLSRMGISASIKGYHFVRQAVIMAVEDQDVLNGITKGLYPDVGKVYKTTASKVERAIRHAIESAWKKNGQQVYFEITGYFVTQKPTNGQFIAALTEHFRMKNIKSA